MNLEVLASQVGLSCKQHLNVLGSGIEDRGEVSGSHLGRFRSFFHGETVSNGGGAEREESQDFAILKKSSPSCASRIRG